MPLARDWKLVFTCPACDRASEVSAANLDAVVRCPHCRTNVVIEKDGMRKVRKLTRRTPHTPRPSLQYHSNGHAHHRGCNLGHHVAWAGMISVFLAIGMLAIFSLSRQHTPDDKRALRSAAELFCSAWLNEDLDTARSFVLNDDRPRLQQWSAPRRAALVAGFGAKFRGRVTTVEIVKNDARCAIVRVAFEIQGREQQVFQDWQFVDDNWRLSLGQAGSQ